MSESEVRNLLALIHRDGGHYTADHGIDKSLEDACQIVSNSIPRASVQPLVNALVALHEASAKVPSEAHTLARDALDYAGTLGF